MDADYKTKISVNQRLDFFKLTFGIALKIPNSRLITFCEQPTMGK